MQTSMQTKWRLNITLLSTFMLKVTNFLAHWEVSLKSATKVRQTRQKGTNINLVKKYAWLPQQDGIRYLSTNERDVIETTPAEYLIQLIGEYC